MDRPLKPGRRKQHGRLLPLILPLALLLVPALGAAFRLERDATRSRLQQTETAARQLAQARAALIARAVADDNRPGSLPCPDLLTDDAGLRNYPDDGKADNLTRNRCPSDLGRLPWATLAQAPLLDRDGQRLWYAIAPGLYDDDNAEPINSDTVTGLEHAGQSNIAALLIAPGAALPGQQRPSSLAADYLENGTGNDRIQAITRSELMTAVESRIVGQVRNCLLRHAAGRDYPWPAPLAVGDGRGQAGSRFGRIPSTQADALPAAALENALQGFAASATPPSPAGQPDWHRQRGEEIAALRNFATALFTSGQALTLAAAGGRREGERLQATLDSAGKNERISRSEGKAIATATRNSQESWQSLPLALADSGLDPWAALLAAGLRRLPLLATQMPGNAEVCQLAEHLDISRSEHPALQNTLPAASTHIAAFCHGDPANAASAAVQAGADLLHALANRRSEILAADLRLRIEAQLEAEPEAAPDPPPSPPLEASNAPARQSELSLALLARLQHGAPPLLALRDEARHFLETGDQAMALVLLDRLASALAEQEASEHNLSRSTLAYWQARQQAAFEQFLAQDQAEPRPLQQDILPHAQKLASESAALLQVLTVIENSARQLSRLALAPVVDEDLPAATADSLFGLAEEQERLEKLAATARENAERAPSRSKLQKADETLAAALAGGKHLNAGGQGLLDTLDPSIGSTAARAWPLVWRSASCNFLRPDRALSSWWWRNRWYDSVFYQFGERTAKAPGRLHLGPHGGQALIVLAAGGALAGQIRPRQGIADYLEGENADPGRNGQGQNPSRLFSRLPRSTVFNDIFAPPLAENEAP